MRDIILFEKGCPEKAIYDGRMYVLDWLPRSRGNVDQVGEEAQANAFGQS